MCRMISTRRVRWSIWREFIIHIGCIAARYPVNAGGGAAKRVTVSGEIEYIETSCYHLEKKAELPIKDVARNALKQADRSLAETVLPFDMKKLRPFRQAIFWDLGRSGATGKRKNLHRRLSRRSSSIRENP